jgi:hypothetical protein
MLEPNDARELANAALTAMKETQILLIVCRDCNARIGRVYATPKGLLMILDNQKPTGQRSSLILTAADEGNRVLRVLPATDTFGVFVVAERKPLERDYCRCGRSPLEFTYDRLGEHIHRSHRTMPV